MTPHEEAHAEHGPAQHETKSTEGSPH
jgi:hypothetical protein